MSLYFILLIGSISVPLALSFDKKLHFYTQWKFVFPSIYIIAAFYIICDIYLTKMGVWGFNPRYISEINFMGLPLEEWLFFIIIPYASIFLHEAFILYFPQIKLNSISSKVLSILLILLLLTVVAFNLDKTYTLYIFSLVVVVLLISIFDKTQVISKFYITFLLILIPFFIVNAILTGSFIDDEVVWYNNSENLGIRVFTIPIEDFGYGFSMILFNLLLMAKLQQAFKKSEPKAIENVG